MTQEDKNLLLKDLCAHLPYGLKCKICLDEYCVWNPEYDKILADAAKVKPELPSKIREKTYTLYGIEGTRAILLEFEDHGYGIPIEFIKPYLRPMSSMTEEESKEYFSIQTGSIRGDMSAKIDLYIKYHFDFRLTSEGLSMIDAGLALEAPEGMYNIKEK